MPGRPAKPCLYPGCGVLVRDGTSRCAKHPREDWQKKPYATKRITGRKLQRLRRELFEANPLCVMCEAKGIFRVWTQRDHVVNLAEGGPDDETNVQGLCDECHTEKTLQEALRARKRG